jgi:hypothetical protein
MRALMMAALLVAAMPVSADDKEDAKVKELKKAWKPLEPIFKTENKELAPTAEIMKDGKVVLANRGAIASTKEYGAVTISFSWQWTQGDDETGKYPDHLSIALRTTGKQRAEWSHEIDEGIVVKLVPNAGGSVVIEEYKQGQPALPVASKKCEFKMGKTYKVLVKDEGKKLTVSIDGKVIVEAKVDEGKGYAVLYGREPVAAARKESEITNLKAEAAKKKD